MSEREREKEKKRKREKEGERGRVSGYLQATIDFPIKYWGFHGLPVCFPINQSVECTNLPI